MLISLLITGKNNRDIRLKLSSFAIIRKPRLIYEAGLLIYNYNYFTSTFCVNDLPFICSFTK